MTHNFSSCQGELVQKTFSVKAVDQDNKNVLVDETMTTLQNGFFEIWLPRNRRIMVNVRQGDLRAEGVIETFPDSKTCVTTFQLKNNVESDPHETKASDRSTNEPNVFNVGSRIQRRPNSVKNVGHPRKSALDALTVMLRIPEILHSAANAEKS